MSDSVELRELRVFLVLAEELHFRRTAERLRLTAPRVSQTIAALERRVGGRLFDRTSRRVELTKRGAQLRDAVAGPYAELLAGMAEVRIMDAHLHGELRIGLLGPASGCPQLYDIAARFEARYPGCRVQISEIALIECFEPLRRGEVDLLASFVSCGAPDLTVGPVLRVDERLLVVATDHPLAGLEEASVEMLGDYPVADCPTWTAEMQALVVPWHTPAGRPIVRTVQITSMGAVWAAVARGEIVHVTAASVRQYSIHPGVVYVPMPDAAPLTNVLKWCTANENPRITAFVAVAEEVLFTPPADFNAQLGEAGAWTPSGRFA